MTSILENIIELVNLPKKKGNVDGNKIPNITIVDFKNFSKRCVKYDNYRTGKYDNYRICKCKKCIRDVEKKKLSPKYIIIDGELIIDEYVYI